MCLVCCDIRSCTSDLVLGVKYITGMVGMAARPGHPTPHANSCCPSGDGVPSS